QPAHRSTPPPPRFRHESCPLRCPETPNFGIKERAKMDHRASSLGGSRSSSLRGDRASPPTGRHDLRRVVRRWLLDGRADGDSAKTQIDRETTMERFAWWLENEAELPPTLDSLCPDVIREFIVYLREPASNGRWGSKHANARRTMRPSSVNTYYR